jgi:hypothetical protein
MEEVNMRKLIRRLLISAAVLICLLGLVAGGYFIWRDHRPQPPSVREQLFNGITYIREVRREPFPPVQLPHPRLHIRRRASNRKSLGRVGEI